jgi:23S rRNA (uridine2552-2'-O)-methyltransferase
VKLSAPQRKDFYYRKAKRDNFRSRAAFKLMELQTKYSILRSGDYALEIGSSPGGWSQIITSITGNPLISVDLNEMEKLENVIFIRGNISSETTKLRIREAMATLRIERFSVILSDAMSKTSGKRDIDHSSSYLLCREVMNLAGDFLTENGNVVVKQFQGDLTSGFMNDWAGKFHYSRITSVAASRDASSEVYMIFKGYISQEKPRPFS